MLDEILTVGGAARLLEVSEGTVRAWSDAGKLPALRRTGNSIRLFKREDVDRVRLERRAPHGDEAA